MKYKVGDKVMIKEWKDIDCTRNVTYVGAMENIIKKLDRRIATVKEITRHGYRIEEDTNSFPYEFTDTMIFSKVVKYRGWVCMIQ